MDRTTVQVIDTSAHLTQSIDRIYIAMEVEKSVPSEVAIWRTKTDPPIYCKKDSQIGGLLPSIKTATDNLWDLASFVASSLMVLPN